MVMRMHQFWTMTEDAANGVALYPVAPWHSWTTQYLRIQEWKIKSGIYLVQHKMVYPGRVWNRCKITTIWRRKKRRLSSVQSVFRRGKPQNLQRVKSHGPDLMAVIVNDVVPMAPNVRKLGEQLSLLTGWRAWLHHQDELRRVLHLLVLTDRCPLS